MNIGSPGSFDGKLGGGEEGPQSVKLTGKELVKALEECKKICENNYPGLENEDARINCYNKNCNF